MQEGFPPSIPYQYYFHHKSTCPLGNSKFDTSFRKAVFSLQNIQDSDNDLSNINMPWWQLLEIKVFMKKTRIYLARIFLLWCFFLCNVWREFWHNGIFAFLNQQNILENFSIPNMIFLKKSSFTFVYHVSFSHGLLLHLTYVAGIEPCVCAPVTRTWCQMQLRLIVSRDWQPARSGRVSNRLGTNTGSRTCRLRRRISPAPANWVTAGGGTFYHSHSAVFKPCKS